eukprot:PhM_4_TR7045/c0_g1_i1/m.89168
MADSALQNLRKVQLTRSSIVSHLSKPNLSESIAGLYVRVLLELEGGGEEYKIGRVMGIERGTEYSGFTYDAMVATDKYLVLELSPPSKADNHYQLNSVSNKEFQTGEYSAWQRDVAAGRLARPSDEEFASLADKIRRLGSASSSSNNNNTRNNNNNGGVSAPPQQQQQQVSTNNNNNNNNATYRTGGGPASAPVSYSTNNNNGPNTAAEDTSSESDYDLTEEEVRRVVEEEVREKHFVIPKDLPAQSTQELRRLEKELAEYIEKVRENLETNSTKCIACMVNEPGVIIMPCKHKVLCTSCCTKVLICPMCRVKIKEVFEPVEM